MVLKHKRAMKIIVVTIMYMMNVIDIQACLTTFINDKAARIIIYNKADEALICIRKNEKRRFGNQHEHAYFAIYMQQPNKPIFSKIYTCKQNACGNNGNIQLKFSDIENGSGAAHLFTIIKHNPHSSMVQELPIVQKHCRACSGE